MLRFYRLTAALSEPWSSTFDASLRMLTASPLARSYRATS